MTTFSRHAAPLTVPFEMLVTAQQVRSYNPLYAISARLASGRKETLAPRAQSQFHDIIPCRKLGIPVAWINRKGLAAYPDSTPDMEVKTLGGLADRLERLQA
jgi:hypothetical protein